MRGFGKQFGVVQDAQIGGQLASTKKELADARRQIQTLKGKMIHEKARRSSNETNTTPATAVVNELKNRIAILEAQNARHVAALKRDSAVASTAAASNAKAEGDSEGNLAPALERKLVALRSKLVKKNEEFAALERSSQERNHQCVHDNTLY